MFTYLKKQYRNAEELRESECAWNWGRVWMSLESIRKGQTREKIIQSIYQTKILPKPRM